MITIYFLSAGPWQKLRVIEDSCNVIRDRHSSIESVEIFKKDENYDKTVIAQIPGSAIQMIVYEEKEFEKILSEQ